PPRWVAFGRRAPSRVHGSKRTRTYRSEATPLRDADAPVFGPPFAGQKVEFGPYRGSLRMAEIIKDLDRPPPGCPRGVAAARGTMGVAEPQQRHRHLVAVAKVAPEREGLL